MGWAGGWLGQTDYSVLWLVVCEDESLGSEPQSLHYCQGYILRGAREISQGCALLMTANKPEKALYRAPTFSLLLVSHED